MSTLFNNGDTDSEDEIKINSDYANNYNAWRQKEELNKLKTKYGDHIKHLESSEENSESSSSEDEDGTELTEELEKKFYKTLACLKNKDPKIYDETVTFFDEASKNSAASDGKKLPKEKKLFLRDYERSIVVERGGKFSDSDDEDAFRRKSEETRERTYVEEQLALKESISRVLEEDEENEESDLLVPKSRTEAEKSKDDETYREWLKGQKSEAANSDEKELEPLRDFWIKPDLDPKEKFLRDYVLNKKFLDKNGTNEDDIDYEQIAHDSDVNLSEDERNIEKQEEFEHKYNFRFEEPDQEFIKRYPRTLENSLRKKDTRRAEKRAEIKERKNEDKIRKREELKQLKAIKRKEIADKIARLKEITGNDDIHFETIDLDGDFDPAEHDRKMQEIFNEEYYSAQDGDIKPEFPDIDEELGIERTWDDYDPENEEIVPDDVSPGDKNLHCEDPQFNMDADYDQTRALQSELVDSTRKKKRRRRSKFAEIIAKEKPKFDPNLHSSYRDYIEQYYALDYEDMIDDLPCRFKYRSVVPNDYGLSVEEILMADDRELNKWCSLKKALEYKPENVEMNEVRIYQQKSKNEAFKKKILKSLYTPEEEEPQDPETAITPNNRENDQSPKKKRKRKKKEQRSGNAETRLNEEKAENELSYENDETKREIAVEKRKKNVSNGLSAKLETEQDEKMVETKESSVKRKKRKAVGNMDVTVDLSKPEANEPTAKKSKMENIVSTETNIEISSSKIKKKKKGKIHESADDNGVPNPAKNTKDNKRINKKNKKQSSRSTVGKKSKKNKKETDQIALLSSERLKAYGLNPKKFKNKLKYGK